MPSRTLQADPAPRVLAATTNGKEVAALRHVLAPLGGELCLCTDAADVLRLCTQTAPAVVLLDAALHGLDLHKTARILARNPVTSPAAVLVVAPAEADDRELRRLNALELFALLGRPLTCETLRETLVAGLRFHADALALRRPPKARPAATIARGCNSLLVRTLHCPFHPYGVEVRYFALRGGKVYAHTDFFDVPHYKQAAPGADFVDYAKAMLCVCPECFFATTEPRYLNDPRRPGEAEAYFQLDRATLDAIEAGAGRRDLLCHDRLGEPAETLFDYRRSAREALAGYELAVESGRALVEAAPARRAAEQVRIGGYELRRATLCETELADPAGALACRRAAVRWLDGAFQTARGAAAYLAAYQLVALCVHLGDDAAAMGYLTAMREMAGRGRRASDDPALLDRYHRRARQVWEARDAHRAETAAAA